VGASTGADSRWVVDNYTRDLAKIREEERAHYLAVLEVKNSVVELSRKIHISSTKTSWGPPTHYVRGHKKLKEALKKLDELEGRK
jgi:hypothetical protein